VEAQLNVNAYDEVPNQFMPKGERIMATLEPGSKAPSFNLMDQDGRKIRLANYRGKKLLLYFYPKANTSG
jgi:peroxiredoxin